MFASLGSSLIYITLLLTALHVYGAFIFQDRHWYRLSTAAIFACIFASFLCLAISFAISDFSLLLVANNSSVYKPLIFKIAATWGNHEGSLLLWICGMSVFAILMSFILPSNQFGRTALLIQVLLIAIFLLFLLYASNPFVRMYPPPLRGMGLNPILQDIGLALHPPVLYMGYVGFSSTFSIICAALLNRYKGYVKFALPFTLFSFAILTLGITLGSWWAYRELGWGGYWFWDPVEIVSLLPWFCALAFLHSTKSTDSELSLISYLSGLAGLIFSIIGTFVVRSGLITSVHSFASDPTRGTIILGIIVFLTAVSSLLLFFRRHDLIGNARASVYSVILRLNIYPSLIFLCIMVMGIFYPVLLDYFVGIKTIVAADFYNIFFTITVTTFLLGLALFVRKFGIKAFRRNEMIVHLGFLLLILSISINSLLQVDQESVIKLGERLTFAGNDIALENVTFEQVDNYVARQAKFRVNSDILISEQKYYLIEEQQTVDAGIKHTIFADLYITTAQMNDDGLLHTRLSFRPMISFIWLSGFMIAFGSLMIAIRRILAIYTRFQIK